MSMRTATMHSRDCRALTHSSHPVGGLGVWLHRHKTALRLPAGRGVQMSYAQRKAGSPLGRARCVDAATKPTPHTDTRQLPAE